VAEDFSWHDGERLIRFGPGVAAEADDLLARRGFEGYTLLTTQRALAGLPAVGEPAEVVFEVGPGKVDELSAGLLEDAGQRPLVALGGGRVVDVAKAVAGVSGADCAAIPTTLAGSPMTRFHRTPPGAKDARIVRPSLVVADPELMTSQPAPQRAASAMNALAHATEALYAPGANPVAEMAALRAASLFAQTVPRDEPAPGALALAAVLAGYAVGSAGLAVHHAVCQTVVRLAGTPHAETNAVMLPHSARLMVGRAPGPLGALAGALGDPAEDPAATPGRIAKLAARSGHTRLSSLGVEEGQLPELAAAAVAHPGVAATPEPPDEAELLELLRAAL
jgi:alcohol dehydrogenase class IV